MTSFNRDRGGHGPPGPPPGSAAARTDIDYFILQLMRKVFVERGLGGWDGALIVMQRLLFTPVILGERSKVTFSFENKMHNHCC